MPGPTSWPLLGTLPYYWRGEYSWERLHRTGLKKYLEYGDCVRETVLPGVHVVWLFHPRDIRQMYRSEGSTPSRRSHTALEHLRLSQPSLYPSAGLLPTNGPAWERIRRPLQKPLLSSAAVARLLPGLDAVMQDAVQYLGNHREELSSRDWLPELEKIFMESTGLVVLERRLDSLQLDLPASSLPARLIRAAQGVNSTVLITDNGLPVWRMVETEEYRRTREGMEVIGEVAREKVGRRGEELAQGEEGEQGSLVDLWLASEELTPGDIATGLEDLLLAGVHTSAYTASFLLYSLARSPGTQARLALEARDILASTGAGLTRAHLASASYCKAVLWESLRLHPVAVGAGRLLDREAVLGGYTVPRGTVVVAMNQVACRLEQYFPQPSLFLPERWLSSSPLHHPCDPFLVLPFGHGPRGCIGRRLAEDSLLLLLLRLTSQYRLEWLGGDMDCRSELINKPDSPVRLRLERWGEGEREELALSWPASLAPG